MFKQLFYLASPCVMITIAFQAHASGYKLEFQSPSVLADAGDAAVVQDAGTNWYNSAGDVWLPQQVVLSGTNIYAPTKFTGSASAPSSVSPFLPAPFNTLFNYNDSGSASAHTNTFLPAIHYVQPLPFYNKRFALGFSWVPAWGFKENYGNDSLVRYDLMHISSKSIDIAPSLSMKVNDNISIGFGPDFHYFSASSESKVRTQGPVILGPPFPAVGTFGDSMQRFSADNWGAGWHAGILVVANERTRIGFNYRSKIIMDLQGNSSFTLDGLAHYQSTNFKLRVPLPATATLSAYRDLTERWAIMGTIAYDQWSVLQNYSAKNIATPLPTGGSTTIDILLPQHMRDVVDFGFGAHYKLNDQWLLRGNVKYLPTPTNDEDRDINFPDGEKLGFQLGARYQMTKKVGFDMVYGHVFVRQVPIDITSPLTGASVDGHSRSHLDIVGGSMIVNL